MSFWSGTKWSDRILSKILSVAKAPSRMTLSCKGIPLGNLTSQVFANIYMNELDQFMKCNLELKHYLRYADDFLMLSSSVNDLNHLIRPIEEFLQEKLKLQLHPKKIILRNLNWGIDFLGYIVLPYYQLPRTKTKKRILVKLKRKIGSDNFNQSVQSYLGYLGHANSFKVAQNLRNQIWYYKFMDSRFRGNDNL